MRRGLPADVRLPHEAEVVGHPTFDRVHPDDQGRLIESWIAMIATARPQMTRVRMRCGGDAWLWVDTTYHNYLGVEGRATCSPSASTPQLRCPPRKR